MTNKQSSRDKIMMGILALVVLAAVWYMLFLTPTKQKITDLNASEQNYDQLADAEEVQLDILKNRAIQHGIIQPEERNKGNRYIKNKLAEAQQIDDFTRIADYSNFDNLQTKLNTILSHDTNSVSLSYENPVRQTNCWRRTINISFKTSDQKMAEAIIQQLDAMENGCLINEVTITLSKTQEDTSANVNLKVTVFEFEESPEALENTGTVPAPAA